MANWSEGYVTDINYTSGFYKELSPVWLTTAATLLGFRSPAIDQPYTYAELGCGQGFGTNLIAASNPRGRFFGFDFNPAQVSHGQRLASESGLDNVEFHDASFQQLATSDLSAWPQFDFITLHGIYSWVSRENQLAIQEFIRRFLKPGGLVYVSYNCSPGWTSMVPLQRLMRLHADRHPARSDVQGQQALSFIKQLQEGGAGFFKVHNDVARRIERAAAADSHYIPHEYLNRDWNIGDIASMAEDCAHAKLAYLGSATLAENLDGLSVPAALMPMLSAETDPILRQTILDFASNKGFRRDIYQKGLSALTPQEHIEAVKRIRLVPLSIPTGNEVKFKTPLGEANGNPSLYLPLLKLLSEGGALSLGEIAARPEMAQQNLGNLIEIAVLLLNADYVQPKPIGATPSTAAAQRLNRIICRSMLDGHNYSFLSAPGIGSAVPAGFVEMIETAVLLDHPNLNEAAFVDAAWQLLSQKGRRLVKDGAQLTTKEASTAELKSIHAAFLAGKRDLWRKLGVLPSSK